MCRATYVPEGSKEHIERLQKWSLRNRPWAQFMLGNVYEIGRGVTKDQKRASELYKSQARFGSCFTPRPRSYKSPNIK